ncbi:MAG: exodeoxyribonuclease VII large subunit [Myxococcota bacterium]
MEPRYTVSELTSEIATILGETYEDVRVEGEISGFKPHSSGHWYFTLKDGNAVLNCAMFRNWNQRVRRPPREGDRVVCRGGVDVYPPRGTYSLVVRQIEPVGAGDLLRRLEELKARLAAEGLFAPERKRAIPGFPTAIGVATSPTGAAFQDVLRVVRQRFPGVTIYLAPCRVQGEGAAAEVARALDLLDAHGKSSVIVVGRGGGSAEDLWAFNEEVVVRAIARSRIPTVSAVGHEVDVTLADLAADVRAATPSHAAEIVTPVRDELAAYVDGLRERLRVAATRRVAVARDRVRRVRLVHPRQRVERGRVRLDELDDRVRVAIHRVLADRRRRAAQVARHLDALSPLAVLARGYAIAELDGRVLHAAADAEAGDRVRIRLARGALWTEVLRREPT